MAPFRSPRSSSHRPPSTPRTSYHRRFYTPPPHGSTNRYRPLATHGIPSERLAMIPEYVLDPTTEMRMEYLRASQAASDGEYFLTFDRRHNTVERVDRPCLTFGRKKKTAGGAGLLTFLTQNTLLCAHAANPTRSDLDCRIDVQNRVWVGDACINVLGAKHDGVLCEYYVKLAPSKWIPRIFEDEDSDDDESPLPSSQDSSSTSTSQSSSSTSASQNSSSSQSQGSTSTPAKPPANASSGPIPQRPTPNELMQFLAVFDEVADDRRLHLVDTAASPYGPVYRDRQYLHLDQCTHRATVDEKRISDITESYDEQDRHQLVRTSQTGLFALVAAS